MVIFPGPLTKGEDSGGDIKPALVDSGDQISGSLRISIPNSVNFWWELLSDFQSSFPRISLDVFTTERHVDLIADGIDAALRIGHIYPKRLRFRFYC